MTVSVPDPCRVRHEHSADVVKLTVYVTDKSILDDYFRDMPAKSWAITTRRPRILVVNQFPRPGVEIEIETIAAKAG